MEDTKIATFLNNFCPDDIYNADGSLCYKFIELMGYKKAVDRITVLRCANIGKTAKPRCFKGFIIENLSVEYHANRNIVRKQNYKFNKEKLSCLLTTV